MGEVQVGAEERIDRSRTAALSITHCYLSFRLYALPSMSSAGRSDPIKSILSSTRSFPGLGFYKET